MNVFYRLNTFTDGNVDSGTLAARGQETSLALGPCGTSLKNRRKKFEIFSQPIVSNQANRSLQSYRVQSLLFRRQRAMFSLLTGELTDRQGAGTFSHSSNRR